MCYPLRGRLILDGVAGGPSVSTNEDYDRGHRAGGIAERLDSHDRHFEAINGSLADIARELHALNMNTQRLGDQADANAKTVVTTAAALKDAVQARQNQADQSWSPMARMISVLSGLAALAAVIGLFLALAK